MPQIYIINSEKAIKKIKYVWRKIFRLYCDCKLNAINSIFIY